MDVDLYQDLLRNAGMLAAAGFVLVLFVWLLVDILLFRGRR